MNGVFLLAATPAVGIAIYAIICNTTEPEVHDIGKWILLCFTVQAAVAFTVLHLRMKWKAKRY